MATKSTCGKLESMLKEKESELKEEDERKKFLIESTKFVEASKGMGLRIPRGSDALMPLKHPRVAPISLVTRALLLQLL